MSPITAPPRGMDDPLALSLDQLRHALGGEVLGHEREWAEAMRAALIQVEQALRQRITAVKAPDGPLAEVDDTRPTLVRQVNALRQYQEELLGKAVALQEEVRCAAKAFQPNSSAGAGSVPVFGEIRRKTEELLAGLQQNKEAQIDLVLESVNTDIGVGD
jgi:hypothetical protein